MRHLGLTEFELRGAYAQLVLDAEQPISLHGLLQERYWSELLRFLQDLPVHFLAELYDEDGQQIAHFHY
ncbi:hypothetical protein C8N29_102250 [Agitococcus lubricus]|uniref:Uncharacterized protein n=1 Tax=Agitococcus lubricus TaxID=1077255 RepID=A0A2T5J2V1_9GAMM|nr:hypothetical protein C8N29_102250 [Agitococcus lubricus]